MLFSVYPSPLGGRGSGWGGWCHPHLYPPPSKGEEIMWVYPSLEVGIEKGWYISRGGGDEK